MINNIADELIAKIMEKKNPCIVGLDTMINELPECITCNKSQYDDPFQAVSDSLLEFNKAIIDSVYDIVPAVKPQMAFYEKYGSQGIVAFEETVKYAKSKGLIVIEDAKRNDIGICVEAYAAGHLGEVNLLNGKTSRVFDGDFITVSPYLGSDGINPFLKECHAHGKGIFILVKTSNPSAGDVQDLLTSDGDKVCEKIAAVINTKGESFIGKKGYSSIGAVVGATYPDEAKKLREIMKRNIFLVPGYGVQGGGAEDVVPCFNEDGLGAIINCSRNIIFAYKKYGNNFKHEKFAKAARQAAIEMRDDVVNALIKNGKGYIYK